MFGSFDMSRFMQNEEVYPDPSDYRLRVSFEKDHGPVEDGALRKKIAKHLRDQLGKQTGVSEKNPKMIIAYFSDQAAMRKAQKILTSFARSQHEPLTVLAERWQDADEDTGRSAAWLAV